MKIDLNCDMGEGIGLDSQIMYYVTSANIACGLHAGSPLIMAQTVQVAIRHGIAIGAHPGYSDLANFGRSSQQLSSEEIEALVLYQVGSLAAICKAQGAEMVHVKPHGALYNQAAVDWDIAEAVATAVYKFSRDLILVGLAGSILIEAGQNLGLTVAREGFPDRSYLDNGLLMPRNQSDAVLEDPYRVMDGALNLATEGVRVIEADGNTTHIPVDTLCLHGDNVSAVENARLVRQVLLQSGFILAPLARED